MFCFHDDKPCNSSNCSAIARHSANDVALLIALCNSSVRWSLADFEKTNFSCTPTNTWANFPPTKIKARVKERRQTKIMTRKWRKRDSFIFFFFFLFWLTTPLSLISSYLTFFIIDCVAQSHSSSAAQAPGKRIADGPTALLCLPSRFRNASCNALPPPPPPPPAFLPPTNNKC